MIFPMISVTASFSTENHSPDLGALKLTASNPIFILPHSSSDVYSSLDKVCIEGIRAVQTSRVCNFSFSRYKPGAVHFLRTLQGAGGFSKRWDEFSYCFAVPRLHGTIFCFNI